MPGPGGRPDPNQNAGQSGGGSGGGGGNNGGGGNGGGNNGGGGNGGGGTGGLSGNLGQIYKYLIAKGFSPNAAYGVIGNIRAESGGSTTAIGDNGTSGGICQWHNERWTALKNFASQSGRSWTDLGAQLDFMMHELKSGYPQLLNMMRTSTNMAAVTRAWMVQFERPADTSESAIQGRIALAEGARKGTATGASDGGSVDTSGGGGSSGGGDGGRVPQDKLTREEMAERYGWAMSFLKSQPELWDLFQKAVNKRWSPQQFAAALRDTKWFQHNSETVRQNQLLKETDPATYKDRLQEIRAQIRDLAGQYGAQLTDNQLDRVARNALMYGWSDSQIQNTLAEYIKRVKGSFAGEAGANEDELAAFARAQGVRLDGSFVKKAVEQIAAGNWDMNRAKDHITKIAMSQFPTLRDDLKAGLTVADAGAAYMNSMANLLELNPAEVDLFDPKIRRALAGKGKDGKPEMKTVWEFEQDLRNDPRWLKTNNAAEQFGAAARQIATDFGLSY